MCRIVHECSIRCYFRASRFWRTKCAPESEVAPARREKIFRGVLQWDMRDPNEILRLRDRYEELKKRDAEWHRLFEETLAVAGKDGNPKFSLREFQERHGSMFDILKEMFNVIVLMEGHGELKS